MNRAETNKSAFSYLLIQKISSGSPGEPGIHDYVKMFKVKHQ